ncbi:3-hydroxyacyl-ACP dehydratase FabZ family protein [Mesonia ostreae]|uniref:Hydroxymyristoyl-ACP dehydratase n=1 Tax=Mesonia ostreae TaxID=861110 RepID=A0ABU2KHR9_9FLAO|nr:hydroxymyristoyl-ACP dehydratase [Mesonia ostreae]MDT0294258.1 hydroxymyristoyl-ACP dehydratase [Mesonia ostreae]
MNKFEDIIAQLPYTEPFLFVNEIEWVNEEEINGSYRFPKDSYFYKGHFKEHPVTPGVILTECATQIGVVCLGIFLISKEETPFEKEKFQIALTSTAMDFFLPVYPGEKVRVHAKKMYLRFNKLKCEVKMYNEAEKLICKGEIAGMMNLKP